MTFGITPKYLSCLHTDLLSGFSFQKLSVYYQWGFPIRQGLTGYKMKKTIVALITLALLAPSISFARGGHYAGGHGSSHKGGSYKNPRTGNHYEKRH